MIINMDTIMLIAFEEFHNSRCVWGCILEEEGAHLLSRCCRFQLNVLF